MCVMHCILAHVYACILSYRRVSMSYIMHYILAHVCMCVYYFIVVSLCHTIYKFVMFEYPCHVTGDLEISIHCLVIEHSALLLSLACFNMPKKMTKEINALCNEKFGKVLKMTIAKIAAR